MPNSAYCCPRCRGALEAWAERYACQRCNAAYPIVAGIADFRVYADPYIGLADDRRKARYLAEQAERRSFPELVAHYYAITPEVTPEQARHFSAHHLAGERRGQAMLARLDAYGAVRPGPQHPALDIGCGTGGFVRAAAAAGGAVTGADIALRWLVVARRQLRDHGAHAAELICACADYLPFPDRSFAVVVAEGLLEHTSQPGAVLAEAGRVRAASSTFMARTLNRYAPAPEPHVGLWGVGLLPRALADRYVRWRRGIPYQHIRLLSYAALRRAVRASGQRDLRVLPPLLLPDDYHHLAPRQRQLLARYAWAVAHLPRAQSLFALLGPFLDVVGKRRSSAPPSSAALRSC